MSIYYIITVRRCMWSSSSSLPGHHTVHGVMSAKPLRVRGGGAEEEPVTTRSTRLTTMSSSAHRYVQPISVLSSHDMVASLSGHPQVEISRGCWLAMAADRQIDRYLCLALDIINADDRHHRWLLRYSVRVHFSCCCTRHDNDLSSMG